MSNNNKIPRGWIQKTIGEIYSVVGGGTPSTAEEEYWDGNIPWITSADINGVRAIKISRYITEEAIKNSATNKVPPQTLLVVTRVGLGKIAIAQSDICFSQDLQGLIAPPELIHPEYALYQLSFILQTLKYQGRGTTISGITKKQLKDAILSLPPHNEQKRIVAKIEELFSELDKGIENLKTAREQLKVYRQAVLKKAFEGKLTADWREENGIDNEWVMSALGECGTWKGGGTPSKQNPAYWENGDILWVSPKDMKSRTIQDTQQKITAEGVENSSTKFIEEESVLFVVRSGILRRILPISMAVKGITINQDMQAMMPTRHSVLFVYWYCHGHEWDIRHKCSKDGTTVESIDVSRLKSFPIPVPSQEEQNEVINRIESILSQIDELEITIEEEIQKSEALRQSILKKAFSGKLVAQDLSDEPASVLLERIKAEKEGNKKKRNAA